MLEEKLKNKQTLYRTLAVLCIISLVVYAQMFSHSFVSLDDDELITQNPLLKQPFNLEFLKTIFSSHQMGHYLPITTLTYYVQFALFGNNPASYKAVSFLLHVLNAFWLMGILRGLNLNKTISICTLGIFLLHPLQVESVAWISARSTLLFSFFYLGALNFYVRQKPYYWMLFMFTLALLCKSQALSLPLVLVVIDWYRSDNFKMFTSIKKHLFSFLLSFCAGVLAIYFSKQFGTLEVNASAFTLFDKPFLFGYCMVFYVLKFVAPIGLSALYFSADKIEGYLPLWYYMSGFIFLGGCVWIYFKLKEHKQIVFGLLFFFIQLFLVSQIFSVGQVITADRYTYLAYIGLGISTGSLFSKYLSFKPLLIAGVLCFSVLGGLTFMRVSVWQNAKTLYSSIIKVYPEKGYGYYGLGSYFLESGQIDNAIKEYSRAIELESYFPNALLNRSSAYLKKRQIDLALQDLNDAINQNKTYKEAYFNRGVLYHNRGNLQGAKQDIHKSLHLGNRNEKVYTKLSQVTFDLKEYKASMQYADSALAINSQYTKALLCKANLYFSIGDLNAAKTAYLKCLNDTGAKAEACFNLANVYATESDFFQACQYWRMALQNNFNKAKDYYQRYCLEQTTPR